MMPQEATFSGVREDIMSPCWELPPEALVSPSSPSSCLMGVVVGRGEEGADLGEDWWGGEEAEPVGSGPRLVGRLRAT